MISDIDSKPPGLGIRKFIAEQVGQCDPPLVPIGSRWLDTLTSRAEYTSKLLEQDSVALMALQVRD